jgi:hypothetical protein
MTDAAAPAPIRQLLEWIAERPRTYAETMEAWKTSCPRLSVWEDALADGLIRVARGDVQLTRAGSDLVCRSRESPEAANPTRVPAPPAPAHSASQDGGRGPYGGKPKVAPRDVSRASGS